MPKGYQRGRPDLTDADYLAKLKARLTVLPNGCWEIQGFTHKSHGTADERGYGDMCYRGKNWRAHRLMFFLHNGTIDPKLDVMHSCDNPPCCNPAHLSQGTRRVNIRDSIARRKLHVARLNKEKTHCPRGHAFAEHAVHIPNKGGWVQRSCRICQRARTRQRAGWPPHLWNLPAQPVGQKPVELIAWRASQSIKETQP